MGYDRGDNFPFDFEPNGNPFGSKSKGKLSPRSYPIQCEIGNIVFSVYVCVSEPIIARRIIYLPKPKQEELATIILRAILYFRELIETKLISIFKSSL